jgi:hypothetical protein
MKMLFGFFTMIASSILLWFLITGLLMASMHRPYMESILSAADAAHENGTIPPIDIFTKTATIECPHPLFCRHSDANTVYSGASVTYTIGIRHNTTDTYSATLKIVDTLTATAGISFTVSDVTATTGITEVLGATITWTVPVSTTGAYSLTYRVQASSVQKQTADVVNTAILYEIDNSNGLTNTQTPSATVKLKVIPWNLYLSNVYTPPPTPTPTPLPLPSFRSHSFEEDTREADWEAGKNIIYSIYQKFLPDTDGEYYAWLGGSPNSNNLITSKKVRLPTGYAEIRIRYRYWIFSEETACEQDKLVVKVNGTERTIETQDEKPHKLCKDGITSGWKNARTKNLASNWSGKEVSVSFETMLNGSRNSNFFVDVVKLCTGSDCQLTATEQFVNPGESNDTNSKLDIPSR